MNLSVIIPALREGENLRVLLPELARVLDSLRIRYEILLVTLASDQETRAVGGLAGSRLVMQSESGFGSALAAGFAEASGEFLLTMDADLSHLPTFIADLWQHRHDADVVIASRYVPGGGADMPFRRYLLSRGLNRVFSRGLGLEVRDMSSGFRLYRASVLRDRGSLPRDFDVLQTLLVRAYAEGWRVMEVPFFYGPRHHGHSHARVIRFGLAYARTFWSLWRLRNSVLCADYDARAYDSPIPLQRYWQRMRHTHVTGLIAGEGPVADIGCGSSRIIGSLPPGSVGLDVLARKLRYARRYDVMLVQGSALKLPFPDESFSCVLCSQVIEHVPKDSPILAELVRILKPGGRLVLGTPDYDRWEWVVTERLYGFFAPGAYADEHIAHYTRDELIDHFNRLGFTLEVTRYILRGELILALRKPHANSGSGSPRPGG
ncbi:MAG: methyltransferase domain-containing protein [Candidatus Rokubacteria bacterium]|nr:methyltransferase domain-containing protein [Candidatus Rokubacteria bacterium]